MSFDGFHPAVRDWASRALGSPTEAQALGWPRALAGDHLLIAAPTGSGKTLAGFLAGIDALVRSSQEGALPDETRVLYVSPLKALSHDIEKNLRVPLAGIDESLAARGEAPHGIRVAVRTGDTPAKERARATKRPPHLFVTTPESLGILLTSAGGRRLLGTVRTVIVDEIHAVVSTKRGAHLALSLERLAKLTDAPLQRIGLSATQKPIEDVARFLVGANERGEPAAPCAIVDVGHARRIDLALELPRSPLEPVMAAEVWAEVHQRIAELVREHRTTIVFVGQRRLCERLSRALGEILGENAVAAHHGSMSRVMRLEAERRLKEGEVRCVIATSSLELGIDVGHVDLAIQIGSPRAIAALLQRVGRSGHFLGGLPKGRLFPTSRDDLVESLALLDAVRRGELDSLSIPVAPLDVLAQQLISEVAGDGDGVALDALYAMTTRAWPYRSLSRATFDDLVQTAADAFGVRRGRRAALVHLDAASGMLRPRRAARLVATSSGGAIPDAQQYDVVLEPEGQRIGSIHEDFAIDSSPGDIFQLGNASWKILRVTPGVVRVEDARGQPPSIPFWFGEGPARTAELTGSVNRMVRALSGDLPELGADRTARRLATELGVDHESALQACEYLADARAALGTLPDGETLVAERFFDEAANTHLVLHTRAGARINRALGLALRKSFCRSFDFELQAAATDDAVVLSLGPTHSFPLEDVFSFLRSKTARDVLVQAVLDAPLFGTRWRWAATVSLAVPRARAGKRNPPARQRIDSEDLLAVVFPQANACVENIEGDREVPDHPIVRQALRDCLEESMDVDGLVALLGRIEDGSVHCIARDLPAPSAMAAEILGARAWAFLDDAPLEERRTQAVHARRLAPSDRDRDLARLDPAAIERVRETAWPEPRDANELHDALGLLGFATASETTGGGAIERTDWTSWGAQLAATGRACEVDIGASERLWVAAERLSEILAIHAHAILSPPIAPASLRAPITEAHVALRELVRSRLEAVGPVTATTLATQLAVPEGDVDGALAALEGEGFAMRGRFTPDATLEWCERRLLARIHDGTLQSLRRAIQPVTTADYVRFLCEWQHVSPGSRLRGEDGLFTVVRQLEGYDAPAGAWEDEILAARTTDFDPRTLDALCLTGRVAWTRGRAPEPTGERVSSPVRATRVVLLDRSHLATWAAARPSWPELPPASSEASAVDAWLATRGASFFHQIERGLGLGREATERALGELVARGAVASDAWSGLRALVAPRDERTVGVSSRTASPSLTSLESAGRWSRVDEALASRGADVDEEAVMEIARILLRRWGVLVRAVVEREGLAPPWRDLVRALRRLEARGEIRGGRFVAARSGEQFALPEAIELLREVRGRPARGEPISVSAADPLNLVGVLTPGPRVPAIASHRVVWCDGVAIAVKNASGLELLAQPLAVSA